MPRPARPLTRFAPPPDCHTRGSASQSDRGPRTLWDRGYHDSAALETHTPTSAHTWVRVGRCLSRS